MSELFKIAMSYHANGLCVMPCKPKTKDPALASWKALQKERPTEKQLMAWFGKGTPNLAVVCGTVSGGLVVIDFDAPDLYTQWADRKPEIAKVAPTVQTGRGYQVYVRMAAPLRNRKAAPDVDIRGEGGYVVAPPSIHPNGKVYKFAFGDVKHIPMVDGADLAALGFDDPKSKKETAPAPIVTDSSAYAKAALRDELAVLKSAPQGNRNNQLYLSSYFLGRYIGVSGGFSRIELESSLTDVARKIGLTEKEIIPTLKSGLDAGEKNPRPIPEPTAKRNGNGHTPMATNPNEPGQGMYRIVNGAYHAVLYGQNGEELVKPLCNWVATIDEEHYQDNGQDTARRLVINGKTENGVPLPRAEVDAGEFGAMAWVMNRWGVRANIRAGNATKDRLRECIQMHSTKCVSKTIYTHTGWREIDGQRVYLTVNGAIGLKDVQVKLDGRLGKYALPTDLTGLDITAAARSSLTSWEIAPDVVTIPIWAGMYLAPLAEILKPDFLLGVYGESGTLKSTITALLLSHYGDFKYNALPENWESSVNSLEKATFLIKDAPLVIDDYAPKTSLGEAAEVERAAQRIIRNVGNLAARNRLNQNTDTKPGYPPRGLVIMTAEQLPSGQSIRARLLPVRVWKESGQSVVVKARVSAAELYKDRYPVAMAAYIQYLASRWDDLKKNLPNRRDVLRDELTAAAGEHARTPTMFANLLAAVELALKWAVSVKTITPKEEKTLLARAKAAFNLLANEQREYVSEERDSIQFLNVLQQMLAQKNIYLLPADEKAPVRPDKGEHLGWVDEDTIYLLSDAAYNLVKRWYRNEGKNFSLTRQALYQMLISEGRMVEGQTGKSTTVFTNPETNQSVRVLHLRRAEVGLC